MRLGPGEYDVRVEQTKPRVRGVAEWRKAESKESRENNFNCNLEMAFDEPKVDYMSVKELSSFASRVPRFHAKPKAIVKNQFSIVQDNNSFVLQKSTDAIYDAVKFILHLRDCQDRDIMWTRGCLARGGPTLFPAASASATPRTCRWWVPGRTRPPASVRAMSRPRESSFQKPDAPSRNCQQAQECLNTPSMLGYMREIR